MGKYGQLQAEGSGLKKILMALTGTNPADTLILDFQAPDPLFLLFKPLHLWYFVMAALAN